MVATTEEGEVAAVMMTEVMTGMAVAAMMGAVAVIAVEEGVGATMVEGEEAVIAVEEVAETPEVEEEVATKRFSAPKCNPVYNKNTSMPHQNMSHVYDICLVI